MGWMRPARARSWAVGASPWALAALAVACAPRPASPSTPPPPNHAAHRADPPPAVRPTYQRPPLPTAEVVLEPEGGEPVTVQVEVAATDATRRRGLMFRRHMPPDGGMLFVFEAPDVQSFWMRNTFLALDILFIDADHRVVGVVPDATPLTDAERAVDAESQYVLEVHAGFAREHDVRPGTAVRFVNLVENLVEE